MVFYIIAFIVLVTLVMLVTCIFVFGAQFNKWEHQVEEEYQRLHTVMEKRQEVLSSFFSIDTIKSWGRDDAFNQSLLDTLKELSGNIEDKNIVMEKHNVLKELLKQGQAEAEQKQEEAKDSTWEELDGYQRVLAMEEEYLRAIEPLQLAIRSYNVLRQVFPASLVAKLLKKETIVYLQ